MALRGLAAAAAALFGACAMPAMAGSSAERVDVKKLEGAALIEFAALPYIQFREDIDAVGSAMPTDPDMMRRAHHLLASHDARAMGGAWIAYAAMIAADNPAFAAEIEKRMKSGKEEFIRELETSPAVVRNMPGANEAIEAIMKVATNDAAKIRKLGDSFIAEAYSMQKVAWARRELAEAGMERVDSALAFAAKRKWKDYSDRDVVTSRRGQVRPNLVSYASWSPEWSGEREAVNPSVRPGTIFTKALILGAQYAMDNASQEHLAAYGLSEKSQRCFTSAKLNLEQCIAATRTPYEEAFCIGQHALNDMSSCVGWPAGAGGAGS